LGDLLIKASTKDTEILDTPFGPISMNESMFITGVRNKRFVLDLQQTMDGISEDDDIDQLLQLEKLKEKYPKEPFAHYLVAGCYKDLKKIDKHEALLKSNVATFPHHPSIDTAYASWFIKNQDDKQIDKLFGGKLYLPDIYPNYKIFDSQVIFDFYGYMADIHKLKGDYETARKCASVVGLIDETGGHLLNKSIDYAEKPIKKWKGFAILGGLLLVVIGVVIAIIWGIIKFFQWIF